MVVAIEKELEETHAKWQETQQQLDKTKSELHDVREELERSQSQLDEVLGELEQTHFELYQLKEKGVKQQSESDGQVKQELEETKAKLQETEQLLEESQSQKETEEFKVKWQETQKQLDKTKSELHDVREELERSQSQLDEVLGELEQKHFELHQLKEKGVQQHSDSNGQVKQELEETKAKLQETEQLLEESQSQLGETMGVLEEYKSQMEQTMGVLEESQGKFQQKQLGVESELHKELEETKSQLRETEELLEKYQSQLEETMAILEESLSKLDSNQKELEQTKFELQKVQQNAQTQPSSFQLTSEKLAQTKSQVNQIVTGLNQLFKPLQLKLELSPDKTQTPIDTPRRGQRLSPEKSRKLKTKSRRENIVVAGVTMFKDEQDIAYHNLVWQYNQGIKRFVVLDNMSSDNTPQEVKRFADDYADTQVYLIEDPEVGYYQSRKMTAAAEFAHKMWGAEWILPFDADEILCSFRGLLHTVLESIPREHICIKLPYKVHLLRSFYDDLEPNPFKRITHRQKGDIDKGAKVIIRWQSGMVIGQGNHNVTIDGNFLPITNNKNLGLIFRHYPFRSKEHIRQKVINGGKAYEAAKDLPKNQGGAWKQWDSEYKIKGEKKIEEMYNFQVEGFPDAIYDPAII
ncbi:MAG: glycosyltransferase family 2 protein [Trichodesmium sp. MAG_R03]|nr:glycosyltransferase family 2 protein [Trichodesmium sp. MAG_R03]